MMFSFLVKRSPVTVKIVRRNQTPCLVASFDNSSPSVVWQFDLERAANATFSLREKEGEWDLVCMTGDHLAIACAPAHFDERGEAEAAFAVLRTHVLRNTPVFRPMGAVAKTGLFLLLVLGLFVGFSALSDKTGSVFDGKPGDVSLSGAGMQMAPSAFTESGEVRPGVPLSADEVLSRLAPQ